MSTNYFHHHPGEEPRHIGKHSVGWQFMFRGYDDTPFGLVSWARWKDYLERVGGEIRGGDRVISFGDFTRLVHGTIEEKNHYDYMKANYPDELHQYWKDPDGWTFADHEFF